MEPARRSSRAVRGRFDRSQTRRASEPHQRGTTGRLTAPTHRSGPQARRPARGGRSAAFRLLPLRRRGRHDRQGRRERPTTAFGRRWRAFGPSSSASRFRPPGHRRAALQEAGPADLQLGRHLVLGYATDEILRVLVLAGLAWMTWSIVVAAAIALMLTSSPSAIGRSARLSRRRRRLRGARENLGPNFGLIAAAALMVDYVMTVAVSSASALANLATAFEAIAPYKSSWGAHHHPGDSGQPAGLRESGNIFAFHVPLCRNGPAHHLRRLVNTASGAAHHLNARRSRSSRAFKPSRCSCC